MNKKLFPPIKKDIKDFLLKEEGNMVKKDVVRAGLGLLVLSLGLKAMMKPNPTEAGACCVGSCGPVCRPSHCSHSAHSSHSSAHASY